MSTCLIGLGSNLGDRAASLDRAVEKISALQRVDVVARSRVCRTRPIGGQPGQDEFLNAALRVETSFAPSELLDALQSIERQLGRMRKERWDARVIDLDLLLYEELSLDTPQLVLPHRRMAFRRFVLTGAVEVAPRMVHPQIGWTVERLWEHLESATPYVAITGAVGLSKTRLTKAVAQRTAARAIFDPVEKRQEAAAAAGSADEVFAEELERMQRRAALLELPADGESVSDFWFAQSLVSARLRLPQRTREQFERQWEALAGRLISPKLLILLDTPPDQTSPQDVADGAYHVESSWPARLGGALREQAFRPNRGPWLVLPPGDMQGAIAESCAAIEAMRSERAT